MLWPELKEFRLVGGTSLSLQTDHRKSMDIDLFSEKNKIHYFKKSEKKKSKHRNRMKKKQNIKISDFSEHLFWDVDVENINFKKHKKYIINRVMQYGFYKDWQNILHIYGLDSISKTATKIRDLDAKSLEFLSLLSGIPKKIFLCYTLTQSNPKHWAF